MPGFSDELLHDVASRVARRIASGSAPQPLPTGGVTVLVLSGAGPALDRELAAVGPSDSRLVAVADSPSGGSPGLGCALARLANLTVSNDAGTEAGDELLARAERVLAPAMSLALASRVASLQADTPSSRVILRAVLRGIPVEASVDAADFHVSAEAPSGIRRAVHDVLERLRGLGIRVSSPPEGTVARARAAGASAGFHPSSDRFVCDEPLADVVDELASHPCSIEPGKPCVECGVCEMRGF